MICARLRSINRRIGFHYLMLGAYAPEYSLVETDVARKYWMTQPFTLKDSH
jgi:hypothetical protein